MAEHSRDLLRLPLKTNRDVVAARQAVAKELKARGLSAVRVTRFATAVSEIARNTIVHGGGGSFAVFLDRASGYLVVECRDTGAGIDDIDRALTDGFSTAGSMGRGLGGAKRLADRFEIETETGNGTCVRLGARL
ncbi:ATP-binding protein [Lutimaribacter marinistellae]|uniref:ATP-binding protein n=1 Tax=Lutimaribacter marinistellae TaxID=1820329 RepID=A0ABV7TEA7_9RHOB